MIAGLDLATHAFVIRQLQETGFYTHTVFFAFCRQFTDIWRRRGIWPTM